MCDRCSITIADLAWRCQEHAEPVSVCFTCGQELCALSGKVWVQTPAAALSNLAYLLLVAFCEE